MLCDEIPARLEAPLDEASLAYEAAYGTPAEAAALARLRRAEAKVAAWEAAQEAAYWAAIEAHQNAARAAQPRVVRRRREVAP
jgi:hypothetical protein